MVNQQRFPNQIKQNEGSVTAFLKQMNLTDVLFVAALATKPLYLQKSGTLQISDILFVLVFGLLFFNRSRIFQNDLEKKWLSVFLLCMMYQFTVNAFWYYRIQRESLVDAAPLLKSNLYYVFNFIVCLTIFQMRSVRGSSHTLKLYLLGCFLSVIVALIGVLMNYRWRGRASGSFNNPNQLGYFCIVVLTAVTFFAKKIKPSLRLILVVFCVGMSLLSMSKASIVASAVLLFAYFINSRDRVGPAKLVSVLLSIIAVGVVIYILMYADWEFLNEQPIVVSLRRRLGSITTENDSDLGSGRGYDRLREIGLWVLSGVGEGANGRFATMTGKEVHSLYASFIVSYGFIGFFMLIWIVSKPLFASKRYFRSLLCISGVLAYCVTHNGIRSTLLWALLAMLLIQPQKTPPPWLAGSDPRPAHAASPPLT